MSGFHVKLLQGKKVIGVEPRRFDTFDQADTWGDDWCYASNNRDYGDPTFKHGYSYEVVPDTAGATTGHALARRYGRAGRKGGPKVVHRMPTGGLVWAVPNSTLQIMWGGSGSRLKIGQVMKAGGSVTTIDHHTADGNYNTAREATDAVARFLAAG